MCMCILEIASFPGPHVTFGGTKECGGPAHMCDVKDLIEHWDLEQQEKL